MNGGLVMATTLENKVQDFLAQKRIAVAGVSRQNGAHPAANLIYRRLKSTGHEVFAVNPTSKPSSPIDAIPTCSPSPAGWMAW